MSRSIVLVCFLGSIVGVGAIFLAIPSLLTYLIMCKAKKRKLISPYSFADLVTFVAIGGIWDGVYIMTGKPMGWGDVLYELVGLGALFGVLLCIRLPFLWRHPEWKLKFALATSAVMFLAAAFSAAFAPQLCMGDC